MGCIPPPVCLWHPKKDVIYAWIMHQWMVNHWIVYCELAQPLWTCITPWKCMNTSISKISSLDCGFFCILILPANVFLIPQAFRGVANSEIAYSAGVFLEHPWKFFIYLTPGISTCCLFFDRQKFFGVKFSWTTMQNKIEDSETGRNWAIQ